MAYTPYSKHRTTANSTPRTLHTSNHQITSELVNRTAVAGLSEDSSPYASYSKYQLLSLVSFKDDEIRDLKSSTENLMTQVQQMHSLMQQLAEGNERQLARDRELAREELQHAAQEMVEAERSSARASAEAHTVAIKAEFAAWRKANSGELEQLRIQRAELREENEVLQGQLEEMQQTLAASDAQRRRVEQQLQIGATSNHTAIAVLQAEIREFQRALEEERARTASLSKQLDATVLQYQRQQPLLSSNNYGRMDSLADVSSPIAPKHFMFLGLNLEAVEPTRARDGREALFPAAPSLSPSPNSGGHAHANARSHATLSTPPAIDNEAAMERLVSSYNGGTDNSHLVITNAIEPAAGQGLVHIGDRLLAATVSKTYVFEGDGLALNNRRGDDSASAGLATYQQLVNELSLYCKVELTVARRTGNALAVKTLRPFCPQVADYY